MFLTVPQLFIDYRLGLTGSLTEVLKFSTGITFVTEYFKVFVRNDCYPLGRRFGVGGEIIL